MSPLISRVNVAHRIADPGIRGLKQPQHRCREGRGLRIAQEASGLYDFDGQITVSAVEALEESVFDRGPRVGEQARQVGVVAQARDMEFIRWAVLECRRFRVGFVFEIGFSP